MYQVIARKFRPQSFDDVIGQEHVKTTLRNAIAQSRIAHGYIFSGQRGTGKTTMARILARCLNCINGPTPNPCGVCASCLEIASGSAVDVIEIDAASNRGINEMRELRENVRYQPARDRYKVFIVDEAHQITNEAFNALLKTIEEPPSWAVFILCTTEAHKIPATIASRCQHFSFRSVDFEELVERLRWICGQEGVEADDEALSILAIAGEGSVRDSLSALDQAIACSGSRLDAAQVRALLGSFSMASFGRVAEALQAGDGGPMLDLVDELERSGQNLQHFARELARYFRNLVVARVAGENPRLIAASAAERADLATTAAKFSEEDLTRYLQICLDLYSGLQFSLQPRFHIELGLLRLVHAGRLVSIEQALAGLSEAAPAQPTAVLSPVREAQRAPRTTLSPFEQNRLKKAGGTETRNAVVSEPASLSGPAAGVDWRARLLEGLTALGLTFTADAVAHAEIRASGSELTLRMPSEFELVANGDEIHRALAQQSLGPIRLKISFGDVAAAAAPVRREAENEDETTQRALAHPEVQRFRDMFGGEVRGVRNLKE